MNYHQTICKSKIFFLALRKRTWEGKKKEQKSQERQETTSSSSSKHSNMRIYDRFINFRSEMIPSTDIQHGYQVCTNSLLMEEERLDYVISWLKERNEPSEECGKCCEDTPDSVNSSSTMVDGTVNSTSYSSVPSKFGSNIRSRESDARNSSFLSSERERKWCISSTGTVTSTWLVSQIIHDHIRWVGKKKEGMNEDEQSFDWKIRWRIDIRSLFACQGLYVENVSFEKKEGNVPKNHHFLQEDSTRVPFEQIYDTKDYKIIHRNRFIQGNSQKKRQEHNIVSLKEHHQSLFPFYSTYLLFNLDKTRRSPDFFY